MTHSLILPIVVPIAGSLLALIASRLAVRRLVAGLTMLSLLALAAHLVLVAADGEVLAYALGGWRAPYGIVLVLDRVAALMLAVTALLAVAALAASFDRVDRQGRQFHALFLLQVAGLNGAFLAGDLFNLFVCFEVLLLASYALLVHGGGRARVRVGLAYVVLNLTGSAVFLVALAVLYGVLGTLNLADAALQAATVPDADRSLLRVALVLLVSVFALKSALLPMLFWLPRVYAEASAPVAALFAIMTKVGVYALLRLSAQLLPATTATEDLLAPWLAPLAIATTVLGTLGAIAAQRLAQLGAHLVLISTGILLAAVAAGTADAAAAALAYIPHTTLVTGGVFILAGRLGEQRGDSGDTIAKGPPLRHPGLLGAVFLMLAVAASGMPPLSGFTAKLMLLHAFAAPAWSAAAWIVLIGSGFIAALALARAASAFFWEPTGDSRPAHAASFRGGAAALVILVAASPLLTVAAAPVARYASAAAGQLHDRDAYLRAVLPAPEEIQRERRP